MIRVYTGAKPEFIQQQVGTDNVLWWPEVKDGLPQHPDEIIRTVANWVLAGNEGAIATMNETAILVCQNLVHYGKVEPTRFQFHYCEEDFVRTIGHDIEGGFIDYWPKRTYDLFEVGFHLRFFPLEMPPELSLSGEKGNNHDRSNLDT